MNLLAISMKKLTLTLLLQKCFNTKYGYGINCITNDGKMITFFDKNFFEIGKKVSIEGIVKEHNVFNNSKITLLKKVKY